MSKAIDLKQSDLLCIDLTQSDSSISEVKVVEEGILKSSQEEKYVSKETSSNETLVNYRFKNWMTKTIGFHKTKKTVGNRTRLKFQSKDCKEQVVEISMSDYQKIMSAYMKAAGLSGKYTCSLLEKAKIFEDISIRLLACFPTNNYTMTWKRFTGILGSFKKQKFGSEHEDQLSKLTLEGIESALRSFFF